MLQGYEAKDLSTWRPSSCLGLGEQWGWHSIEIWEMRETEEFPTFSIPPPHWSRSISSPTSAAVASESVRGGRGQGEKKQHKIADGRIFAPHKSSSSTPSLCPRDGCPGVPVPSPF